MDAKPHMELDNQLCFLFYACSREITRLYRPLLDPLGLTYTQYVTLLALWRDGKKKVKDLGAELYLDSGTLTPLLKKLEATGVVKRTRDRQDERNVWIEVTEAGWRLREEASHVPYEAYCRMGVTPEEGMALHGQMTDMLKKLQATTRSAPPAQDEAGENGSTAGQM
jgi:MarR family transcriptional regulator, organic hydroperoxide resistance regulator